MADHAIISPSSAERSLICTPSARLGLRFPDNSGVDAKEGTHAHYISEVMLRHYNREISKAEHDYKIAAAKDHELYKPEMIGHCGDYADNVMSKMHPDSILLIERRFTMEPYIPEGFGTGDATIITPSLKLLDFSDLKYGKGVPVSAIRNTQLRLYGVGALIDLGWLYDIDTVKMWIYRPRLDSISSDETTSIELLHWAETYVKPRAALAFKGEGELVAGKHCRFCRASPRCRALEAYRMEMEALRFRDPFLLEDDEILDVLDKQGVLINWLNAVDQYVYAQALLGKKWPGYKLVEGSSDRVFRNRQVMADKLLKAGYEDIYEPEKLKGIGALTALLGKKTFRELVEPGLFKPDGKPVLAKEDDTRKTWDKSSVFDDYNDI